MSNVLTSHEHRLVNQFMKQAFKFLNENKCSNSVGMSAALSFLTEVYMNMVENLGNHPDGLRQLRATAALISARFATIAGQTTVDDLFDDLATRRVEDVRVKPN